LPNKKGLSLRVKKRKKKQTQPTKKLSANFGLFEHLLKFLESKNANPSGYVVKPGAFSRKSPLTFKQGNDKKKGSNGSFGVPV
jgi:hypothetical protein